MRDLKEILAEAKVFDDDVELSRRLITPEAAKLMLENNSEDNRSIRQTVVEKYARSLKKGDWEKSNPCTITFWKDGTMVDGQHRLMAIAQSGISTVMTVAIVPVGVAFFDGQAKRSTGNYIEMKYGCKLNHQQIGALTMQCSYTLKMSKAKSITPDEIYGEYAKDPDLWELANRLTCVGDSTPLAKRAYAVFAAHSALKAGLSEEVLTDFFRVLNSGFQNSKRDNQAVAARNAMLANKNTKHSRTIDRDCAGILEEYIRLFANGSVSTRKVKTPTWCFTNQIMGAHHEPEH